MTKPKPKKPPPKKAKTPAPVGRPSKYDPAICAKVIEWGKQGKSREWICASLDIVVQTMANYERQYPEFLEAMERSGLLAQQWWEDAGQNGMLEKSIDASIYSRSMAARFPNKWRENRHITLEQPDISHLDREQTEQGIAVLHMLLTPKRG